MKYKKNATKIKQAITGCAVVFVLSLLFFASMDVNFRLYATVAIRGVKNFMLELQSVLKNENNVEYREKKNQDTVLALLVKHFLYELYVQLHTGKSIQTMKMQKAYD